MISLFFWHVRKESLRYNGALLCCGFRLISSCGLRLTPAPTCTLSGSGHSIFALFPDVQCNFPSFFPPSPEAFVNLLLRCCCFVFLQTVSATFLSPWESICVPLNASMLSPQHIISPPTNTQNTAGHRLTCCTQSHVSIHMQKLCSKHTLNTHTCTLWLKVCPLGPSCCAGV